MTAVELLPVHAFLNDRFLVERGLRNYWGYNTAAFFAPEPSYLSTHRLDEMRIAVRQLHAAGIEVILDVVYNHTCEGGEMGPTVSWRGLDNASYYRLVPGDERHHINDTGCGNTREPAASTRAADGDGFAALLVDGVQYRRLPFRSRRDARPRTQRLRSRLRLFRRACARTRSCRNAS